MPKQAITVRRTETISLQLDTIQPLTKQTLTALWNESQQQGRNSPPLGEITNHQLSDWSIIKINPECECLQPTAKSSSKSSTRRSKS